MGTCGAGSFENDDAMDWQAEIIDSSGESMIREALTSVVRLPESDYLEAPACQTAIAAAEVVAAGRGKPAATIPDEVAEWVRKQPKPSVKAVKLATRAPERIVRKSELKDLWAESGSPMDWEAAVTQLRERLEKSG